MDFEFSESDGEPFVDAEMSEMLDLIGKKCSICFTADSETDLVLCGDQFCYNCLETYWRGRLEESLWGIRPVSLDCPVCRTLVADSSWLEWIGTDVREMFLKTVSKKPTITRTCQDCGHEQSLAGEPMSEELLEILDSLKDEISQTILTQFQLKLESNDLMGLLRCATRILNRDTPTPKLVYFFRKILQASQHDDCDLLANKQLAVIYLCSGTLCDFCSAQICVRCGQADWHAGLTCLDSLRDKLRRLEALDPEASSLAWKVSHCRPCPRCFLLVTKDDDGSCNQMRCSHCGHSYCWECLREWSNACGYYRCSMSQSAELASDFKRSQKHHRAGEPLDPTRTEAGIPDVAKLPTFTPS